MDTQTLATIGGIAYAIVIIAIYVWSSLATSKVFVKLDEPGWKAWVPVLNAITILELGSFSAVWVVALFFPLVQIAGLIVFFYAVHNINKRFDKGAGFTVLAVLAYPIWASLLGFGKAQPVVATEEPLGRAFELRMNALQSVPTPTPFPPAPPVGGATSPPPLVPQPASAPQFTSTPPLSPPPPPPAAPVGQGTTPPAPTPAEPVTSHGDPWSPPINSVPGMEIKETRPPAPHVELAPAEAFAPPGFPVTPAPVTPAPVAPASVSVDEPLPAPVSARSSVNLPASVPDDDFDRTIISSRRKKSWYLAVDGASPIELSGEVVYLGRNPAPSATDPGAQLVAVPDSSKTMSKTHARLQLTGGEWFITDLHSTNGVVLMEASGDETEVVPGQSQPLTDSFKLGQLTLGIRSEI